MHTQVRCTRYHIREGIEKTAVSDIEAKHMQMWSALRPGNRAGSKGLYGVASFRAGGEAIPPWLNRWP